MQGPALHQGGAATPPPGGAAWIWLIAGTGEGPALTSRLLERGWSVRVSVVSAAAARAYDCHPQLELWVGALDGPTGPEGVVLAELQGASQRGTPFRWLIDASHPFAQRISAALALACARAGQPLLRLERPRPAGPGATVLADLESLAGIDLRGRRLLLAIGARRLAEAVAHSPGAVHHARLLPSPGALRLAMAAGLGAAQVACLRPPAEAGAAAAIEAALCRRWRIEVVLCRRSGGPSESHWRRICAAMGLRLLLLERPPEPRGATLLPLVDLLERVGEAPGALA
jgi:precorrin-6A/cobalt-precorrin-6A reductase